MSSVFKEVKTAFGCGKQGPLRSCVSQRCDGSCNCFGVQKKGPEKKLRGLEKKKTLTRFKGRKSCLILRDSRPQDVSKGGLRDDLVLMSYSHTDSRAFAKMCSFTYWTKVLQISWSDAEVRLILAEIRHCFSESRIINCQNYSPIGSLLLTSF